MLVVVPTIVVTRTKRWGKLSVVAESRSQSAHVLSVSRVLRAAAVVVVAVQSRLGLPLSFGRSTLGLLVVLEVPVLGLRPQGIEERP